MPAFTRASRAMMIAGVVIIAGAIISYVTWPRQQSSVEYSVHLSSSEIDPLVGYGEFTSGSPSRRVLDYTWQLYLGASTEWVEMFFDSLSVVGENSVLSILDASGNEVEHFRSPHSVGKYWTNRFMTNSLRFHLVVNSAHESAIDLFKITRVRVMQNDGAVTPDMVFAGAYPNVAVLQNGTSDLRNREVQGILGDNGDNYYIVNVPSSFACDFAVVGDSPYGKYDRDRDCWFHRATYTALVGDLNHDGFDDITVGTEQGEWFVSVNDGHGFFHNYHFGHRKLPILDGETVFAGNMNQDGYKDLLLVSQQQVRYVLNNGNTAYPQFGSVTATPLTWSERQFTPGTTCEPVVGDFNGDGLTDIGFLVGIASTDASHSPVFSYQIRIFANDGHGGFLESGCFPIDGMGGLTERGQHHISVGDVDGDGRSDLVIAHIPEQLAPGNFVQGSQRVAFRVLRCHPSAADPTQLVSNGVEDWGGLNVEQELRSDGTKIIRTVDAVVLGDLNGDGREDVLVREIETTYHATTPNHPAQQVYRLLGEFSKHIPAPIITDQRDLFGSAMDWSPDDNPFHGPPGWLLPGRFDQTGRVSLLTWTYSGPLAHLYLLSNENQELPFTTRFGNPTENSLLNVVSRVADLNGDHKPDVVIFPGDSKGTVETLWNSLGKSFARSSTGVPTATGFAKDFTQGKEYPFVADINGDHHPDLVLVSGGHPSIIPDESPTSNSGGIYTMLNNGSGSFSEPTKWKSTMTTGLATEKRFPIVGDFNGDAFADLAIVAPREDGASQLSLGYNRFSGAGQQMGGGTTGSADMMVGLPPLHNLPDVAVCDIDRDGSDEIILFDKRKVENSEKTFVKAIILDRQSSGGITVESRPTTGYMLIEGLPEENHFSVGKLRRGNGYDIVCYSSSPLAHARISTWTFHPTAAGEQPRRVQWFDTSVGQDSETDPLIADCDGDGRDELLLVQRGRWGAACDALVLNVDEFDVDLYVQPFLYPAVGLEIPTDNWTAISSTPDSSDEFLMNQHSETGLFIVRVHNNGSESGQYTLLSNMVLGDVRLNALVMETYPGTEALQALCPKLVGGSSVFLNAFDGTRRFTHADYWALAPGGSTNLYDYIDMDLFDLYYIDENSPDRHPACVTHRDGESAIVMYKNADSKAFVHEYGHYGFNLADEYCEDCGNPPESYRSLCPNCIMNAAQGEFCTSLYHNPWGAVDQAPPACWEFLGIVTGGFLPQYMGSAIPKGTPNPHAYNEPMFSRVFY